MSKRFSSVTGLAAIVAAVLAVAAGATHSWGGYHWARTANPFTLKLGDNLSTDWKPYLGQTSYDWTQSAVLDTTIVTGQSSARRCRATSGRVEVCNAAYGNNGWLGLAQIWISSGHITQGVVKVNDTYFTQAAYNNPDEKNHVMCQEVGHTLGLDHQSTDGSSLGTCMDYSTSPASTHPNAHDYEQLGLIYAHLDSSTTLAATTASLPDAVPSWAAATKKRGDVYVDRLDDGSTLVTFVIWVDGQGGHGKRG